MIGDDQISGLQIEEQSDLEDTLKGPDTVPDSCKKDYTSQKFQDTGTCFMMMNVVSEVCIL
jgi:hypothetical protein